MSWPDVRERMYGIDEIVSVLKNKLRVDDEYIDQKIRRMDIAPLGDADRALVYSAIRLLLDSEVQGGQLGEFALHNPHTIIISIEMIAENLDP
ncbi:MAG: hypothetical protein HZA34_04435 [Candidatus Pacebacteria bacterium]|nr:hypothetical protein [Candidatus Paceibacterota bacterium]